jgi:hypothetical protein
LRRSTDGRTVFADIKCWLEAPMEQVSERQIMRVNPDNDVAFQSYASAVQSRKTVTPTAGDEVDLSGAACLEETVRNLPLVRPDKVAHAKALLEDPSYPNDATMEKVAGVLAENSK